MTIRYISGSVSLIIREMQFKATVRCYNTLCRMAIIKKNKVLVRNLTVSFLILGLVYFRFQNQMLLGHRSYVRKSCFTVAIVYSETTTKIQ